jgi:hypothetical protein
MKLFELEMGEVATGYYDPSQDNVTARKLGDTRRPSLTLRKLNRLKKMRAMRTLEKLKRQDLLAVMYGQPEADQGPGGMPF